MARTIRSQLAMFVKQVIGRVRRGISRKTRSMALWSARDASRAAGCGRRRAALPSPAGGRRPPSGRCGHARAHCHSAPSAASTRLIDPAGHVQAPLAISRAQMVSDIPQDMDPAGLSWHVGIDQVERRMEAAVAVGGDQRQGMAGEPAAGEGGEEGLQGILSFGADHAIVEELTLPSRGDPIGDEDVSPPRPIRGFHAQGHRVTEGVAIRLGQRAPVERCRRCGPRS